MNKKLEAYEKFAKFCIEHQFKPAAVINLWEACQKVYTLECHKANGIDKPRQLDRARDTVSTIARGMDIEVDFAGVLWPHLTHNGYRIFLPNIV